MLGDAADERGEEGQGEDGELLVHRAAPPTLLVDLFPGYAPIALPATTEVFVAHRGADQASLGYRTTTRHYGKGAWQATVRRLDGRIQLTIESRMTPLHPLAVVGLPLYRWYQKRAHRLGAENLGRMA